MATKKTPVAEPEKKPRKKTPAYKNVQQRSTFGSVADAFSEIENLASECREIVDNASEGLQQTQRIQTFEETASTLENVSEVGVPDCLSDVELVYSESVPTDKRRSPSRATRCGNVVAVLQAAADRAREIAGDTRSDADEWENADDTRREELTEPDYTTDQCDEMDSFADELENVINDIEGCEFPGMYG